MNPSAGPLHELDREARMGAHGTETQAREVRCIDLSDFDERRAEIADRLWAAAVDVGFFQVANHGIPQSDVEAAFRYAAEFFALPDSVKADCAMARGTNAGWESRAQVRPSTRTPDQKESYQITRPRMDGLWPGEHHLPGFRERMLAFESQCWTVGMRILSCLAVKLGMPAGFFTEAHDPSRATYQSTLRLLHYYAVDPATRAAAGLWRAGAHTDFDCLTLLFQRTGQGGLQLCPGKDMDSQQWTSVEPADHLITCNIGDMLMRWSGDVLPSNFHRVRNPRDDEYQGPRYSLAFFCQANTDVRIETPGGKYPPITAHDYLQQRIAANF
ncbi:MAG TPA: 2-oxoglutarate and iron-dependent oxygenase domain-containing protein [Burkholderiaceae bacterium]|nr:2-oxoglutarate and iron-dependent oxygenase domain-containing protein [Burkholderiaceae bacterium]